MKYIERPAAGQITDLGSMALQNADNVQIAGGTAELSTMHSVTAKIGGADIKSGPDGRLQGLLGTAYSNYLMESDRVVYGLKWDAVLDTYTPVLLVSGQYIEIDYTDFPIQELMKRCVLDNTGAVQYYLDPDDSTKKADGSAANIDGTDGPVMVEVPAFHYAIFNDGNDRVFLVSLSQFVAPKSDTSTVSSVLHPWFNEGGVETEKRYFGAFEGILYHSGANVDGTGAGQWVSGDLIRSVAGYKPLTYESRTIFRTGCSDGAFHQLPYWANEAIILLYLTEYKNWNSQSELPGYTGGGSWDFVTKVCKTGITKTLGNASGSILWQDADSSLRCSADQTGNVVANSFRGIENFYGHLWKWVDGININFIGSPLTDAPVYICNDPDDFADGTATDYTDLGIDLPFSSGYQTDVHDGTVLPATVGGSSSTYITDYFYVGSAGWRALRSGGDLSIGADAGCASRAASNAASLRYSRLGGRVVA